MNEDIIQFVPGGYVDQAKESKDISEYSYKRGVASLLDYLDSERTYRANQLAYRQALAGYMTALEQIARSGGNEEPAMNMRNHTAGGRKVIWRLHSPWGCRYRRSRWPSPACEATGGRVPTTHAAAQDASRSPSCSPSRPRADVARAGGDRAGPATLARSTARSRRERWPTTDFARLPVITQVSGPVSRDRGGPRA